MTTTLTTALSRSLRSLFGLVRDRDRAAHTRPARPHPWEKSYPPGVDWGMTFPTKPAFALLDEAAAAYPDNVCISFRGRRYRYREVAELVRRAAKGFQALGVRKGIKVGLMLPNCPYAVICFHAVLKAGGTVVNINPLYSPREIERQIADSGLCMLATLDLKGLYEKVEGLLEPGSRLETLVVCRTSGALRFGEKILFDLVRRNEVSAIPDNDRHLPFERLIANDGRPEAVAIDPAIDIAVYQYTGGTTGLSKAACLTHANLVVNAMQVAGWATEVRHGREKVLGVLPLFHAFGMTGVMNMALAIGAEMVLLAQFKPAEALKAIDRERPTVLIGVPTMFSALIANPAVDKYDLSCIRFCVSGGAPLLAEIQRRFEALSGCTLVEGYGLSETAPIVTVNPFGGKSKPGSVGLPLPGTVVEIVSLDGRGRVLPAGERGEICVTGPQVMAGYANRARENVDIFKGNRLHTGDVGYLDDDGYLFIVDRIKELILSSGFNVYPRAVEEVIQLHRAVAEVAVCGVLDRHRGETVKAFVTVREGETLTAEALREFLADKLAPFQMPRRIEFRDSLPKTLIGKISKKDLIAQDAAAAREREFADATEK